jgi:hypothetical protein
MESRWIEYLGAGLGPRTIIAARVGSAADLALIVAVSAPTGGIRAGGEPDDRLAAVKAVHRMVWAERAQCLYTGEPNERARCS